MLLLSAEHIRTLDKATCAAQAISSFQLMERASAACTTWITAHYSRETPFLVLCGGGNNGGDGLCITRQLAEAGYAVKAILVAEHEQRSADNRMALTRLSRAYPEAVEIVTPREMQLRAIPEPIVLLDALWGTGLNRPLSGDDARVVDEINTLPNTVIAIDLPSGLSADTNLATSVVEARITLSIGTVKRSLLHPETGRHAGRVVLLPIDLAVEALPQAITHFHTFSRAEARLHYQPRTPFTHKGTYGTALVIGGQHGMIGAAALATAAASRGGAGKVIALVPACGYTILQTLVPDAVCRVSGTDHLAALEGWEDATAVAAGPGMGTSPETREGLLRLLAVCTRPLVLDADALRILASSPQALAHLPPGTILTPHPGEFRQLFGDTPDSFARVDLARREAMRHRLIIVLKDHRTAVCLPDGQVHYNLSGNAALATGGSGDVLCGLITGLLASGYTAPDAALLGVYLHGMAGEIASRRTGMESVVAGDVAEAIGKAFRSLTETRSRYRGGNTSRNS